MAWELHHSPPLSPRYWGRVTVLGGKKTWEELIWNMENSPTKIELKGTFFFKKSFCALRILTPPIKTPDPPNDTPGSSKHVILTPHDIPRILRVDSFSPQNFGEMKKLSMFCFSSGWVVLPPK